MQQMLNIKLNAPYALFFFILPILVLGHGDEDDATAEADMESATEMSMGMGTMKTAFHFTPGDTLWFEGWVPTSNGGMFAACLTLFLLAILERGIIAIRGGMEAFWKRKIRMAYEAQDDPKEGEASGKNSTPIPRTAPFIPAHDLARGVMQAAQATLGFGLMLAVMTFQLAFLLSVVIGLGVGEAAFGRFSASAHIH